MAQEPESERNASGIARTSKRKWGYDSEQVDAFLERAHCFRQLEYLQVVFFFNFHRQDHVPHEVGQP